LSINSWNRFKGNIVDLIGKEKFAKGAINNEIANKKRRIEAISNYWLKELKDKMNLHVERFIKQDFPDPEKEFLCQFNHIKIDVQLFHIEIKDLQKEIDVLEKDLRVLETGEIE